MVIEDIASIRDEAVKQVREAKTSDDIEDIRIRFLGRKNGEINRLMSAIPGMPPEDRGAFGKAANDLKKEIEQLLGEPRNLPKRQHSHEADKFKDVQELIQENRDLREELKKVNALYKRMTDMYGTLGNANGGTLV